jgi:hypothetical protein
MSSSTQRWIRAIAENIALWLIAYVICAYMLREPSLALIALLPASWLGSLGMASGITIFGSLYLMQENFISPHGNLYRILYGVGCLGLAVLNAGNLPVFTLQIIFVLYLVKKIVFARQ